MSDEFVEFKILVPEEDRLYFRELTGLMSEYRGDFYEAIRPFNGEVDSGCVGESYKQFMRTFSEWVDLCTRLSMLDRNEDSAPTDEDRLVYRLREGVEGYYKERILGFLSQAKRIERTFSSYDSTSGEGDKLSVGGEGIEDDDLPF